MTHIQHRAETHRYCKAEQGRERAFNLYLEDCGPLVGQLSLQTFELAQLLLDGGQRVATGDGLGDPLLHLTHRHQCSVIINNNNEHLLGVSSLDETCAFHKGI